MENNHSSADFSQTHSNRDNASTPTTESMYDVFVGFAPYPTYNDYIASFKRSFDLLFDSVRNSEVDVDLVAYPMLLTARHYLEVGLKASIRYLAKYSGKITHIDTESRDLVYLFQGFKYHIDSIIEKIVQSKTSLDDASLKVYQDYCSEVAELVAYFEHFDRDSYDFRYPIEHIGGQIKLSAEKYLVKMDRIKDLLDKAMFLFNNTPYLFFHYIYYADIMEEYFAGEKRIHRLI